MSCEFSVVNVYKKSFYTNLSLLKKQAYFDYTCVKYQFIYTCKEKEMKGKEVKEKEICISK